MQIVFPKLTWYQDEVAQALESKRKDAPKYITWLASRRIGKSVLCKCIAVKWCLDKKQNVGYVVPTSALARDFLREILTEIKGTGLVLSSNVIDGYILFANGSVLRFLSAEGFQRGLTFHKMIIDEASFLDTQNYLETFVPMQVNCDRVVMVSTPMGVGGAFYDNYQRGLTNDKHYKSFKTTIYESGLYQDEEIEVLKKSMPDAAFSQEFLCEFLSGGISAFGQHYLDRLTNETKPKTKKLFAGIDFSGAKDTGTDETVLFIVNENYETVFFKTWAHGDFKTLNEIGEILKAWGVTCAYGEENSIGMLAIEQIKKIYRGIVGWQQTNTNKRYIVDNVITNFEQGKGSIPDTPSVKLQFGNFVRKQLKTTWTYENLNTHVHDDIVIAYCLACAACKANMKKGNYVFT